MADPIKRVTRALRRVEAIRDTLRDHERAPDAIRRPYRMSVRRWRRLQEELAEAEAELQRALLGLWGARS